MTQTIGATGEVSSRGLVARAQAGDMTACDELVTCYRARAVRMAQSFLRDHDLAEDIAQEAFVRAFLALGRLRNHGAFFTYLTRTIVRLCIDRSRRAASSELTMNPQPPSAEERMSLEETVYIHEILKQLSWKLRTVIVLRDVNGLDYAGIAKTLRVPVGTVRSRLSAARAEFRRLYLSGTATDKEA